MNMRVVKSKIQDWQCQVTRLRPHHPALYHQPALLQMDVRHRVHDVTQQARHSLQAPQHPAQRQYSPCWGLFQLEAASHDTLHLDLQCHPQTRGEHLVGHSLLQLVAERCEDGKCQ